MEETITCKCGHTDTLKAFPLAQPWMVFRCPSCRLRWVRALCCPMGGGKTRIVIEEYNPCDPRFAQC